MSPIHRYLMRALQQDRFDGYRAIQSIQDKAWVEGNGYSLAKTHNAVLNALACSLRASQKAVIHVVALFVKGTTIPCKVRLMANRFLTRCTHQTYLVGVLIILGLLSSYATANSAPSSETQLKYTNTAAYLGIRVDVLSEALAAQLDEDILVGQGIMVSGFAPNTTAKKQGIKHYDILLAYDQQPLMHPKELINRIKNDKPGHTAKLTLSRKGKIMNIPVILGSQQYPLDEDQLDYQYNMQVKGFDGMEIKMFSEDDFEAAIRYLSSDGVVRSRTFSGNYGKILHEVHQTKGMSNIAKEYLLRALAKRKDDEEGWFGKWIPFNDGNFSPDSLKNFGL